MVNLALAGRRVGILYCTPCGLAQADFTDALPGDRTPVVLRTSGLLSRSTKVNYALRSRSVLDTLTGRTLPARCARRAYGRPFVAHEAF